MVEIPNDPVAGTVILTVKDLYTEMVRLTGEVRSLNESFRVLTAASSDHESRLRSLEKWRYTLPTSIVISVGSIVVSLFVHFH